MATPIPKNEAAFSLAEIALATLGDVSQTGATSRFAGVSSDSRNVCAGEIFVALRGAKFDGHEHVADAVRLGAGCVVVSREVEVPAGVGVVRVADTLAALGALGREHAARWRSSARPRRTIGITGSAGKTTTRHATTRLLAELGLSIHSSAGNLNNEVGVPFTLLGLSTAHEACVIELGMNSPGEIARLAAVTRPEVGVVTLVAEAHTEGVGSIWGVLREKSSLLAALPHDGVAIANGDDDRTRAALVRSNARRRVVFGEAADAEVRLVSRALRGLEGSDVEIAVGDGVRVEARVPLLGAAGVYAVLAAVAAVAAVAPELATDRARMSRAIAALGENEAGRLRAERAPDDTVVIDDAYNANPASMLSSIRAARELADALERPLALVLGGMFELGARSAELHREVGRAAAAASPGIVVVAGAAAEELAIGAEGAGARVVRAPDAQAAEDIARAAVPPGAVALVKASNSVGLPRVARALVTRPR
ncbi:MAG: UDP-N-acetylmuramoyl-tripeptide--D-alanyl-D-alanine ligase [Polyangiaceae bacterium]